MTLIHGPRTHSEPWKIASEMHIPGQAQPHLESASPHPAPPPPRASASLGYLYFVLIIHSPWASVCYTHWQLLIPSLHSRGRFSRQELNQSCESPAGARYLEGIPSPGFGSSLSFANLIVFMPSPRPPPARTYFPHEYF